VDSTPAHSRVATKQHGNPWPPEGESWKWRSLFGSRLVQAGLAILTIATVSLTFHDPFDLDDRPNIERLMKLAANSVRADIAANMEARISAQLQLARPERSSREWELAANLFLTQHPGYVGLELLDETYRKRRMAVLPQEAGLDQALELLENVRLREMLTARSSAHEATATPIKLQDGRPGYLIVVPSFAEEKLAGFVVVVCDVKQTLDSILSDQVGLGYSIAVLQDFDQLYLADYTNSENRKNWSQVVKVPLPFTALNWQVEVWPTPQMLAEARSRVPELGAIFALLLLLLLASTIHLARTLQVKSADLQAAHAELEQRVQERTAELRQTNEGLRNLSARVLHLQDEERRRIARELHDSTVQALSALKINISHLRKLTALDDCHSCPLLQQSGELAEQALNEVRTMSYLLHPPILEDFGLEAALSWYADGFRERCGVRVHVEIDPDLGRFSQELELILFRIVQEALGNIHRHSGSPTARIVLSRTSTDVTLIVSDEGCGLPKNVVDPEPGAMPHVGVGITGMRERVRQFGGKLEITSTSDGTTVRVVLPVDRRQQVTAAA
jgi:signal transduction histidine kinase